VDVLAESEDELSLLVTQIQRNPVASAVLVEVLRGIGSLTIQDGLALESLAYATLQGGREFARWLSDQHPRSPAKAKPPAADVVLLERQDDQLDIVLDCPRNRNALSTAMRDGLTDAFRLVATDDDIRHVEVRANGPCFSAGGDLTEFGTARDPAAAHRIRMLRMPARYLAAEADRYHFHVHGACVGAGIELPAFAGRITAAADTFFQLPEVAMGLIPGAGGCVSIPRRIGRQRTAYMALTNRRIGAQQALAWGLVDAIEG
jgi:enoyl-CoA hydratase/carnithine racemase